MRAGGSATGPVVEAVGAQTGFHAQVAAELDAGVGAGDVVETRTIQGANLHILDRFGLDRKVGRLSPGHGEQGRR